jgi:hypothetical protein
MLPKHHYIHGNDLIYELAPSTLDGIRFVLAILDVDD